MPRTAPLLTALPVALALWPAQAAHGQAAIADVQVAPPSVSINAGQRASVFATAYDAKGNVVTSARITWSSSNPAVVRIESDSTSPEVANLVAVGAGAAVVEARVGNRRGVATVQVNGGAAAAGSVVAAPPATPQPIAPPTTNAVLLKLDPTSLFLLPGESGRLTPLFLKDDGSAATPSKVTWKSLVPNVANVDAEGGVVGIAAGQGLIEASAGALAARVPVVVQLSSVAVSHRLQPMSPGTSDTFVVMVPDQNKRVLPATSLQWRSADESVVRVSPFGVVTAVGGGRTEVIASGFLQEIRVPVSVHKPVEFLKLSPPAKGDTVRIPLGATQRFIAEPQASDGSPVPEAPLSWRLLDTSVVSFDQASGIMAAKRVGTTRLRISTGSGALDTAWTVSVVSGGLRISSHLAGLGTGERLRLGASYTDDAGQVVAPASGARWSSSAPSVAQVDGDGNVTAVGFGRASIVASTPWGKADTLTALVQGELIVTSTRAGSPDLWALDRKAPTAANRLTSLPSNEVGATYAPGGTSVIYVSSKDGNQELYSIDADGANPRRLTNTPAQEDSPDITPDGKHIVYASNATGSYQIWIMNADGTEAKRLTDGPAFNFQPAVSPDGKTIAFTTTRESGYDIYLMNLDGTNQRSAFKSPAKETMPQWFPTGQLAFLQDQRNGTARNSPMATVVVKRDPASGQMTNLTPLTMVVTDFAISQQGDLLALIVSSQGQNGAMSSKLFLSPGAGGAAPTEVPLATPTEQVFSPTFRR